MPNAITSRAISTVMADVQPSQKQALQDPKEPGFPDLPANIYGMGMDSVVAALVSQSASVTQTLARDFKRAEKKEQLGQLEKQISELHDKARCTAQEGLLSGALTIAGGAATIGSAAKVDGDLKMSVAAKRWESVGSVTSQLGAPVAKMTAGAGALHHEADATAAAAAAKNHEGAAEEWADLEKQSSQLIEKATAAIQNLTEMKNATMRVILRAG